MESTWDKLQKSISLFRLATNRVDQYRNTPEEYDQYGGRIHDVTFNLSEAESQAYQFKSDAMGHVSNLEQEAVKIKELSVDIRALFQRTQENNQELEQALGIPEKLSSDIKELTTTLEEMTLNLVKFEIKPAKAKLRIRLFMCIWPWVLICLVFASFTIAFLTQGYEQCGISEAVLPNGVKVDH